MTAIANNADYTDCVEQADTPKKSGYHYSTTRPAGDSRSFIGTPIAGFGGVITVERGIVRKSSTGGTVSIWVGCHAGNSGQKTITWDMQDGSRAVTDTVSGYAGLSKTLVFADGEHGWKEIQIPLQSWTLTDWEHVVFRITNVTIDNAAPFYEATTNVVYIRIDDNSVVNTSRLFCDKDHVSASDSNAGTQAAPFATLKKLADEMVTQNKSGYVVAAATAYEELGRVSGSGWSGWSFNRTTGGANYNDFLKVDGLDTSGNRISTAFTGAPLIDNDYQDDPAENNPACGLYIHSGNSLWFSDIEMQNCRQGFLLHPQGSGFSKIIAERIESHGHVGGDNRASFRWDNSIDCLIHNCKGYRNYDNRSGNTANPYNDANLTAGTYNGESIYSAHNGFQAFGADSVVIEYSEFSWCGRGIYGKEQRDVSGSLSQSIWVRNCKFDWCGNVAYESANQGNRPGAKNAGFMFNTAYKTTGLFFAKDGGSIGDQADGAFVFNNSGDEVDYLYHIQGATGVRVVDNSLDNDNSSFGGTPKVINLMTPENGSFSTFVASSKANTLHSTAQNFFVDENGANEVQETTLGGWQTVYTDHATPATSYMSEDPEENSNTTDPGFTDAANGDFSRSGSPTDSYYGNSPRGALFDASTVVGNYG